METKVAIIGGGLVGSLCACFMAQRNYNVSLYEKRTDIRSTINQVGKSINLALSHRGRQALRNVGLEDLVLKDAVPMKGRLLHDQFGKVVFVPYDAANNKCLYSISRNNVNRILLDAAESQPKVKLNFNHELTSADFQSGQIRLKNLTTKTTFRSNYDFIIGADGAHSSLRKEMQNQNLFSFSQQYIEHGYIELVIDATKGPAMIPNCLHIWPRGEFMLIALPNSDQSWTVTLFMPYKNFESLLTPDDVFHFFSTTFPDSIDFLGEEQLKTTFLNLKPRPLITITCSPYHFADKYLLIGDAAHAMVPFYGQGMNCGFEDCTILDEILERHRDDIKSSIREFSKTRMEDGHCICQLAMYNYVEMRDLVTRDSYRLRKRLDDFLYGLMPNFWIPLYISVTFSDIRYSQCLVNKKWQDKIVRAGIIIFALLAMLLILVLFKQYNNFDQL